MSFQGQFFKMKNGSDLVMLVISYIIYIFFEATILTLKHIWYSLCVAYSCMAFKNIVALMLTMEVAVIATETPLETIVC